MAQHEPNYAFTDLTPEEAAYLEREYRRELRWHSRCKLTFGPDGGRFRR